MNTIYRYRRRELGDTEASIEANLKKVKGILNRVTLEKFHLAFKPLLILNNLVVNGESVMQQPICELIFEVAVKQPIYSKLYARICAELIESIGADPKGGQNKDNIKQPSQTSKQFKLHIMSLLQKNFEKISSNERALRSNQSFKDENGRILQDKIRKNTLGLLLFIGALYCYNVVTSSIINSCMSYLINKGPTDTNIELFCRFFKSVGSLFDQEKNQKEVLQYFDKVDEYFKDKKVSFKAKHMLLRLNIDKKDKWIDLDAFNKPQTLIKIREWYRLNQLRDILLKKLFIVNANNVWIYNEIKPEHYKELIEHIETRLHEIALNSDSTCKTPDLNPLKKRLQQLFITIPELVPIPAVSTISRPERDDLMVHNTIVEFLFNADFKVVLQCLVTIKAKSLCDYFVYKILSYGYDKGLEVRKTIFALLSYSRIKGFISIEEFVSGARKFCHDLYSLALDYPKAYLNVGTLLASFPLTFEQLLSMTILLNEYPSVNGNGAYLFFHYWVAAKSFHLENAYAKAILQRKDDTSVLFALWNPRDQTLKNILKLTLHPEVKLLDEAFSETIWFKSISNYKKESKVLEAL